MTITVDRVDVGQTDRWFSDWSMKESPVAMFQNSSFLYWEKCRSDGFALITGLWLLSALWSWFRIISHLSTIKLNHTGLRSPKWAVDQSLLKVNNGIVSHFMMSVTGVAAHIDRAGIYWIPQGKDCHLDCQIEDIHTVFPANKHIVCSDRGAVFPAMFVMFVYNECFFVLSIQTQCHTAPYLGTLLA